MRVEKDNPLYTHALAFMEHHWGTTGKGIFPGSQPVSIEYRHFGTLKARPYVVCEKTDGTRCMLMAFMFQGRKVCLRVNRALEMVMCPLNFRRPIYEGTILEGELYGDDTLMLYDALLVSGVPVGHLDFLGGSDTSRRSRDS